MVVDLFLLLKYYYSAIYYNNIYKFTKVYNSTQFSQVYLIARINLIKQYLYNESISVFNYFDLDVGLIFKNAFFGMSDEFQEALKATSKTTSFLKSEYTSLFKNYVYNNYTEVIEEDLISTNSNKYREILANILSFDIGFK